MTYEIGQTISINGNECVPRSVDDWLCENDAHLEFKSRENGITSYIIVLDDKKTRNEARISRLKKLLSDTDYQAIKHSEGWMTEEEYAPMKEQRRQWRAEINRLEEELSSMNNIQE